jgi:hypothetical protein
MKKKLEAKKPIYYPVGVNVMTPFAVNEQVQTKELGEERSRERRAQMETNRHNPDEALPSKTKKDGEDKKEE